MNWYRKCMVVRPYARYYARKRLIKVVKQKSRIVFSRVVDNEFNIFDFGNNVFIKHVKLLLWLRDTSKMKSPTMHFTVTIYFIS